jgi:hypothetical protein
MVAALDHMIERGTISLENGKWELKVPLEEIEPEVPETVRQMIEVQVEQPIAAAAVSAMACVQWLRRQTPDIVEASAAASKIARDVRRASEII